MRNAESVGGQFTFNPPRLRNDSRCDDSASKAFDQSLSMETIHLMLVDHDVVRTGLRSYLETGWISGHSRGKQRLEAIHKPWRPIHVVVMDILPGMDGLGLPGD
jgi:hypothetical protein